MNHQCQTGWCEPPPPCCHPFARHGENGISITLLLITILHSFQFSFASLPPKQSAAGSFYTIHFCAARLPPSTEFAGFEKYPKLPVIDVILKKGSCQNHGTNSVTNSVYKQEHHLLHRNFIFFFADPFCGPFSAGIPAILTSQQKPYHFSSFRDLDDLCSIKHSGKNGESLGFWLS